MYDNGTVQFYLVDDISTKGQKPKKSYTLIHQVKYDYRTVGLNRYSIALQNDTKIDNVIRIPETFLLEGRKKQVVAVLSPFSHVENSVYNIYQLQHLKNEKNLRVCDVSLERLEELNAEQIVSNL